MRRLVLGALVAGVVFAGCGGSNGGTERFTASEVEDPTTTSATVPPTTTTTVDLTMVAMAQWAGAHVGDAGAIQAGTTKIAEAVGDVSDALGAELDAYLANPAGGISSANSERATAAEKRACAEFAAVVRTAKVGLPAPVAEFNEPYGRALDSYLDAARACQLGLTESATASIRTAGEALSEANSVLGALGF